MADLKNIDPEVYRRAVFAAAEDAINNIRRVSVAAAEDVQMAAATLAAMPERTEALLRDAQHAFVREVEFQCDAQCLSLDTGSQRADIAPYAHGGNVVLKAGRYRAVLVLLPLPAKQS